jgi:hypothetical protein
MKMSKQLIWDANGAVFFNRELEHVKAKSYDVLYQDLMYRQLFPVSTEAHPGATSITYQTFDRSGTATIINDYGKDLPRCDVAGKETTIPIRTIGTSFGYTKKEIKASQMVGRALDQRRADAARRKMEEKMNAITFFGDADAGIVGLFTNTDIPRADVVDGVSTTPQWSTKTPDEILFDINDMFADTFENTLQKESLDHIMLPTGQWSYIASTARSTTSDTTILNYVVQNSPYISSASQIIPVPELNGAGTAGVDVMVGYTRRPDKLQIEIPEDINFLPVQERVLEMVVPVTSEFAGLNIYYPLSLSIREKI